MWAIISSPPAGLKICHVAEEHHQKAETQQTGAGWAPETAELKRSCPHFPLFLPTVTELSTVMTKWTRGYTLAWKAKRKTFWPHFPSGYFLILEFINSSDWNSVQSELLMTLRIETSRIEVINLKFSQNKGQAAALSLLATSSVLKRNL